MRSRGRTGQQTELLLQVGLQLLQELWFRSGEVGDSGRFGSGLLLSEGDGGRCLSNRLSWPRLQLHCLL